MTIYLYKKTHNITGLQYLGKTIQDPHTYKGSGLDWEEHLKQYGDNVTTEILKECSSSEELSTWGRHYSRLWNVVESPEWANKIPETGGGPGNNSETAKEISRKMVVAGTHNFLGGVIQSQSNLKRIKEGSHPSQLKKVCNHCGKTIDAANYGRWHGEKCRSK